MKGPDFICIGEQKCGTTWLYHMLRQHPMVELPKKEIHFFNDAFGFHIGDKTSKYPKGITWYRRQFPEAEVTGEVATNYLWDEHTSARIHKHFPSVKIFAILRDPVERAYSQYLHTNRLFNFADSFEEAVQKYPEILERGLYYRNLKRYTRLFDSNQLKILFFDDLKERPEKLLKELDEFLGITTNFPPDMRKPSNSAKVPKNSAINKGVMVLKRGRDTSIGGMIWKIGFLRKMAGSALKVVKDYNLVNARPRKLSQKIRRNMLPYFIEDIRSLERYTGRDLSTWKKY